MSPEDGHGQPFAQTHEFVLGACTRFTKEINAIQEVIQMAEPLLQFRLDGIIGGALEQVERTLNVAVVDFPGHIAIASIAGLGARSGLATEEPPNFRICMAGAGWSPPYASFIGRLRFPYKNYGANPNQASSFANFEMTSMLTPVLEKPPSWKRFCMVTYRVRSLNRVAQ